MLVITMPGRGRLCLEFLVLDLNGTLTLDGVLIAGVAERLERLSEQLCVYLLTADTRGTAAKMTGDLMVTLHCICPSAESERKRVFVTDLGATEVVAIGNGANDGGMLEVATLGIAVLGPEGLATSALSAADVLAIGITEALDLLLVPDRLIATLRC